MSKGNAEAEPSKSNRIFHIEGITRGMGDYSVRDAQGAPLYLIKNKFLGLLGRISVTTFRQGSPSFLLVKKNVFALRGTFEARREDGEVIWIARSQSFFGAGGKVNILAADGTETGALRSSQNWPSSASEVKDNLGKVIAKFEQGSRSSVFGGKQYILTLFDEDADEAKLAAVCALHVNHVQGITA